MPVAHGAPPSAHPIRSETNVTEFGWKPEGTDTDTGVGVAEADGGGDGSRLGAAVTAADGDELGLPECFAGAGEHAASRTHTDPAHAEMSRGRNVRVITARNVQVSAQVTTRQSPLPRHISVCAEPVTVSAPSANVTRHAALRC